ncbi:EF-P beta-lysylation protein EpmB [Reinekea sp.]|jgi:EF-P beta-lysylation protein EpmB|uniref:EF-P beta-lysylation protein EpmB n=1 Tax=Reinekea sp. TaxID=1970455 RepID=UPI00398A05BB
MIPVSVDGLQSNEIKAIKISSSSWQKQLATAFKSASELLHYLNIDPNKTDFITNEDAGFVLRVPKAFADLMNKGDKDDPLLQQVMIKQSELLLTEGYLADPLQEASFNPTPGLIHKYGNRALLIAHQSCAVHCRYCFRRHFPYDQQQLRQTELEQALDYLKQRPEITEVILSGGDPLNLSDRRLEQLISTLDQLPNLTTIRIHSRTPVVVPDRISPELIDTFARVKKKIVLVLHINHSNEIGTALAQKLPALTKVGVTLLNQSVLLRGVNDNAQTLIELSNTLWQNNILPYYLHLLDPVQGAAHFNIEQSTANTLWQALQSSVSGYLLPRLVREVPEKSSKTWTNPT